MSFPELTTSVKELFDLPETAQRMPNICSMVNFFPESKRLMDGLGISSVVEIGSESGIHTSVLLNYIKSRNGKLITVDPAEIKFPFQAETEPTFEFFRETSGEFLRRNIPAEIIFLDGDHNYESVMDDLQEIHKKREICKTKIVFMHDVNWPWARRDIYYSPERIRNANPYQSDLAVSPYIDGGSNALPSAGYVTATQEGGVNNGVLTAVEDFIKQYSGHWKFLRIPVLYGIGILYSTDNLLPEEMNHVETRLSELASHRDLLATLELNRIENLCYLESLHFQLNQAGNSWRNDQTYIKEVNTILPSLSGQIEALQQEKARADQMISEKQISLDKVNSERDAAVQDLQKTKLKLESAEQKLQKSEQELVLSVNKLSDTSIKLSDTEKKLENTALKLRDTELKLSFIENDRNQLQNEKAELKNKLQSTENILSAANQELASTYNSLKMTESELSDREEQLIRTQADFQESLHRETELRTVVWSKDRKIREMQLNLKSEHWRYQNSHLAKMLPYPHRNKQRILRAEEMLKNGSVQRLSLDIFDTLLFRRMDCELQHFHKIARGMNQEVPEISVESFYAARVAAHELAYRTCIPVEGCREATCQGIFKIMAKILGKEEFFAEKLLQMELAYERKNLFLNESIWKLVKIADEKRIPVILASDMYWGEAELKSLMETLLPEPGLIKKIYSSSGAVSKASGLMFDRILCQEGCSAETILHIGDNDEADFRVPYLRCGIMSIWMPRSVFYKKIRNRKQKKLKKQLHEKGILHGVR